MFASNTFSSVSQDSLKDVVRQAASRLRAARALRLERARVRLELEQYSDRDLADMGLGRGDIDGIVTALRPRAA